MNVIYYNSYDLFVNKEFSQKNKNRINGFDLYTNVFDLFTLNVSLMDRTHSITTPINTHLMSNMELPTFTKNTALFSDICDARILELAKNKRKIVVMYSGGIDSTLILASIIKNFTPKFIKEKFVVLLSEESINENKNFFYSHVLKYFTLDSSLRFPYYLGDDDYLFLTGENADQLFTSMLVGEFCVFAENGYKIINNIIDKDILTKFVYDKSQRRRYNAVHSPTFTQCEKITNILLNTIANAPIKIETYYQLFWWWNFILKWQSVYTRILPYSRNLNTLKLEENYTTFYCNKEFQVWSMNNYQTFASGEYSHTNCKLHSKKYIIDVNGDKDYVNKPKLGSLCQVTRFKELPLFLFDNMTTSSDVLHDYINVKNDFI